MAIDFSGVAADLADVFQRLRDESITEAQAATELGVILKALIPELSVPGLAAEIRDLIARIDGLILTDGPPSDLVGEIGTPALDLTNSLLYPPKTVDGWTTPPIPTIGGQGPAGTIEVGIVTTLEPGEPAAIRNTGTDAAAVLDFDIPTGVGPAGPTPEISIGLVETLAPGASVVVEISGPPEDPVLDFGIPQGDTGATGAVPNVSANINMIANDGIATVTRSGPDTAPVLTFNIPSPLDGADGREVEFNKSATHIQTRYVGDSAWVDLISIAELKGAKGDKGDGLQIDARGANLAARDAFDSQPEDFTFLDLETGLLYWRETAVFGVWSTPLAFGTALDAILEALSELDATPGLIEQTGATTFVKREIGVGSDDSLPTRLAADGRYRRQGVDVALAEVEGLSGALAEKADAGAVLAALGGKQDASATLIGITATGPVPAGKLLYSSAEDAFALADLTGVARTLIGQTTQALMRTAGLGFSTFSSSLAAAADKAAVKTLLDYVAADIGGLADLLAAKLGLAGGTMTGTLKVKGLVETRGTNAGGALNVSTGTFFEPAISSNTTISLASLPASPTAGDTVTATMKATITGTPVLTWPSGIKWIGGTAPTIAAGTLFVTIVATWTGAAWTYVGSGGMAS